MNQMWKTWYFDNFQQNSDDIWTLIERFKPLWESLQNELCWTIVKAYLFKCKDCFSYRLDYFNLTLQMELQAGFIWLSLQTHIYDF